MSHINLFISAVSDEFSSYRDPLRKKLTMPGVSVSIQEDFYASGSLTLENLDDYIRSCMAVVHLVGDMCGAMANRHSVAGIRNRYADLAEKLPCMKDTLDGREQLSYTQWEAMLAIYHGRHLFIATPLPGAPRHDKYAPDEAQKKSQQRHLERLRQMNRHDDIKFADINALIADVAVSKLLPLLAPAQKTSAETLSPDRPSVPGIFLGRDKELEDIRSKLDAGCELMLINAEGGIGKTTLAAKYWHDSLYHYRYNAWLFCENGIINELKKLAPRLDLDLRNMTEEEQVAALKAGLQQKEHGMLLVLDNANRKEDIEAFKQSFRGFHWHVLITSRCRGVLEAQYEYPIYHLLPPFAKELFESNYKEASPEFDTLLDELLKAIGYHTLLTEIFSKYMRELKKRGGGLKEFVDRVQKGLYMEGRALKVLTGYTDSRHREAATTDDILNVLYEFSGLVEAERRLLVNIALLPAVSYPLTFLAGLFRENAFHFEVLEQLAGKGWLDSDEKGGYRISPVIQAIALEKNKATLQADAAALVDYLNERLDNDGTYLERPKGAGQYAALVESITRYLKDKPFYALCLLTSSACVYFISTGDLSSALAAAKTLNELTVLMGDKDNLAISCQYLGNIYEAQGKLPEALHQYQENNRLKATLHDEYPDNVSYKNGLAISCQKLGRIHAAQNKLSEALHYYEEYNRLEAALHDEYPDNVSYKDNLAVSCQYLGNIYVKQGKLPAALHHYEEYNRLEATLHDEYPDNASYKYGLAISCQKLGKIYAAQRKLPEALYQYEEFNRLEAALHNEYPDNVSYNDGLAVSCQYLGDIYEKQGKLPEALHHYEEYNRLEAALHDEYPDNVSYKYGLVLSHAYIGSVQAKLKSPQEAATHYYKAKALTTQFITEHPDYQEFKKILEWVVVGIAGLGKE